jgi:hypothetical protein
VIAPEERMPTDPADRDGFRDCAMKSNDARHFGDSIYVQPVKP